MKTGGKGLDDYENRSFTLSSEGYKFHQPPGFRMTGWGTIIHLVFQRLVELTLVILTPGFSKRVDYSKNQGEGSYI